MSPELNAKVDAVFALNQTWEGSEVRIQERFMWETAGRRWGTRSAVSRLHGTLEGVGLSMCGGTISFSLPGGEIGVILSKLESIEFPDDQRVELVERHAPQVWRRVQVERLLGDS